MKKIVYGIIGLSIVAGGLFNFGVKKEAAAEINVSVNLGPPVIMSDEPNEVVYVPSLGIYFVPDAETEIYFYSGYWWSLRGSQWYRSRNYRSGWHAASRRQVPSRFRRVPQDYRQRYSNEPRYHYQDWKANKYRPLKGYKKHDQNEDRGNRHDNGGREMR